MAALALLAMFAAIVVAIRRTRDVANLFVLSNLVPFLAMLVMPAVAPYLIELDLIDLRLADAAWIFAIVSVASKLTGFLLGLRSKPWEPDRTPIDLERTRRVAWFAFGAYAVLFAPLLVMVGLKAAFADPRVAIYEGARLGAGHFYFTSAGFLTLFSVLGIYSFRRKWLVVLVSCICSLPFGQKTRFLVVINIVLVYLLFFHKDRQKFRQRRFVIPAIATLVGLMTAAFWYTSYGLGLAGSLEMAVGFGAEYQFNFSYLTRQFSTDYAHHLGGSVFFDDNVLALIPRFLWTGKPEYLGMVRVSEHVLPEKFSDAGASSFGPFGQPFVDWGYWGLLQVALQDLLQGYLLGKLQRRAKDGSLGSFLLVLSVGFGGIITSAGSLNYVFWMLLNILVALYIMRFFRAKAVSAS